MEQDSHTGIAGRSTAIVIGASSGIGRATARALAPLGWNLVLAGRSPRTLELVAAQCSAAGSTVLAVPTDVGDAAAVDALFAAASAAFGRADAVVNTAAAVAYGRFEDVPAEVFDRVLTTNLLGTANVARSALRHFRQHGGGTMVLTGSLLGKIAVPFMSPYVTSKWGVHALTRMLQIEAREQKNVRITLVSPGSVNTPAYSQAANYFGRQGQPPPPVDPPEKVARAIVAALDAPRRERSVGVANPLVVFGFRVLPALYDLLVGPLMKIGGLSRRPVAAHPGTVFEPHPDGEAEHGHWNRFGLRTDPGTDRPAADAGNAPRPEAVGGS